MKTLSTHTGLDCAGLFLVVVVSLGYMIFGSSFAEWHLQLSFLDFPVFIGEGLLMVSALVIGLKVWAHWPPHSPRIWWLAAYSAFVLFKAGSGYVQWGPLALRDAALFYYPFFILVGYSFWDNSLATLFMRRVCLVVVFLMVILRLVTPFWIFPAMLLALILAWQEKRLAGRFILVAVMTIAVFGAPVCDVSHRTVMIAVCVALVFLVGVTVKVLAVPRWSKVVILGLSLLAGVLIIRQIAATGILSTMDPWQIITQARPAENNWYQSPLRGRRLFNPDGSRVDNPDRIKALIPSVLEREFVPPVSADLNSSPPIVPVVAVAPELAMGSKKDNAMFRYYIWRDMLREFWIYKPWLGFDFGRPLRSPSLENYAYSIVQEEDGWIGAHNSWLYMIYKAGWVGVGVVLMVLVIWFRWARDFIIQRRVEGILLSAVILYWMTAANFFLIFELPYTAIPIWTLWGIMAKYRDGVAFSLSCLPIAENESSVP